MSTQRHDPAILSSLSVSPKLFSHWLMACGRMFNALLFGDEVARSRFGVGGSLAVHHWEGDGSDMMNAHHGLHAAVRSNGFDVHRATWMNLKA